MNLLKFQKDNLKPNHPNIGDSMNNLASVIECQNRLIDAEKLYRETLQFW